jgi:hypothetical protein
MSDNEKTEPAPAPTSAPTRPTSILSNPKDQAARPGFRSPANARTKAQKGGKKK